MNPVFRVEVLGFGADEIAMIASTFALSARRALVYIDFQPETRHDQPDVYLVDSDDMSAMLELMSREPTLVRPAILVGNDAQGTQWPLLERPIRWSKLFSELDKAIETAQQAKLQVAHSDQSFVGNVMPRKRSTPSLDFNLDQNDSLTDASSTDEDDDEDPLFQRTLHQSQLEEYALLRPDGTRTPLEEAVLVIDTQAQTRQMVVQTLLPFGLFADPAENVGQALSMLDFKSYTLIVIGPHLTDEDGFAFCKRLKTMPHLLKARIILIGGRNGSFDRMRARFSGCDAYLSLPLDEDKLIAAIAKLLPDASKPSGQ